MIEPCGILLLNKPSGITSHNVVSKVRKLYNTKKVGHTGTLDPMATGLLIILIGRAAKASNYIMADSKEYIAGLKLGIETDSYDVTGNIIKTSENIPSKEEVEAACLNFIGKQKQIPPMYSAIKKDGHKMVDLARKGITVELDARDIEIFAIIIEKVIDKDEYLLDVKCSKGTYIRSLCNDIGVKLGCGGTMSELCRISSGKFNLSDAFTLTEIEDMSEEERLGILLPVEDVFDVPKIVLPDFFSELAHNGALIYQNKIKTNFSIGSLIKLYDKDGFFALGEVVEDSDQTAIKPVKQFIL